MLRFKHTPLIMALTLALAACGSEPRSAESAYQAAPAPAAEAADSAAPAASDPGETARIHDSAVLSQTQTGRQLMVAAALDFETENVRDTAAAIEALTLKEGGFVQQSNIHTHIADERDYPQQDGTLLRIRRYVHQGSITVRIPRERAAAFLTQLQSRIRFLDSQTFSATDLSLDIRRQQLIAERERDRSRRLAEVADSDEESSKRGTVSVVQSQFDARAAAELARLQEAYWQDQVDFATLSLNFKQAEALAQQTLPDANQLLRQHRPGFWASAANMLEQGWHGLLQVVLTLLVLWPLWLVPGAGFAVWRIVRRRQTKK